MKLTFLGTSTSVGIPVIGCDCEICSSDDPLLKRMRASVHIDTGSDSILVDSGPDLHQQAHRHGLRKVDAVLYTHQHLDHTAGFDELRAFCWGRDERLPMYSTAACLDELKRVYNWAFSSENTYPGYIQPDPRPITGPFEFGGIKITALPVVHGKVETIGYRFDSESLSIAYIPDVKTIHESTYLLLEGLDHLIIDCLREAPHSTHMCLEESLKAAERVGAKRTWLTHIAHEIDVREVEKSLPETIRFAYDTLTID